jgi:hypothetical protein
MALPQGNFRTTHIEGVEYQIKLLGGRDGFRTAKDLSKVLLPLLGESVDASRHDDVFHGAPKTFRDMALLLMQQIDSVDVEDVIFNRLFSYLMVDGSPIKLDDAIVGKYHILIDLIMFAVQENFGSLFEGKGLISRFQSVVKKMDTNLI